MTFRLRTWLALLLGAAALCCARGAWAQPTVIPTPLPTPAPRTTPTPNPFSAVRVFHCNCFGPGQPVAWAGNVQASSYFQARQQAGGECLAYIGEAPAVPLIPTPSAFGGGSSRLPGSLSESNQQLFPLDSAAQVPRPPIPPGSPCSNCACN